MSARLAIEVVVEKHGGIVPRKGGYFRARLGNIDATGKTSVEARDELAAKVVSLCQNVTSPTVMFDLVEPHTVWVAYPCEEGWMYSIIRQFSYDGTISGGSLATGGGGRWDRDECMTRMREHWYQNNIEPIVYGIVALCTDLREFECRKCGSASRTHAPYICRNPACGSPFSGKES